MKTYKLVAEKRQEIGKKATKAIRKNGEVPVNLYGLGNENLNLKVKTADVQNLIFTPESYAVELTVEGALRHVVLKELQFHPVTDQVLHIDFLEVDTIKPINMKIPVVLEGLAAGVRAGGKLVKEIRRITVRATYDKIPERLYVNVEHMNLGETIKIGDLHFDGLEIVNAKNAVVAAVRLTRAARGAAAAKAQ